MVHETLIDLRAFLVTLPTFIPPHRPVLLMNLLPLVPSQYIRNARSGQVLVRLTKAILVRTLKKTPDCFYSFILLGDWFLHL